MGLGRIKKRSPLKVSVPKRAAPKLKRLKFGR